MKLFDLHCDTIYECCETGKHLRENDLHINYAAAHRYQPYVQFFALFCGARQPYSPETRDCLLDTPADERFDRMLTTARREFAANADWLTFCRSAADIRAAVETGKAAALLSIEGAELLPDRPDALDYVYDAGVRLITLTWNYRSRYGCSSAVDQNEGLTELGKQLVRDCGEKGILVDVSHLSDRGFWDVCEATDRPFVATHSDSRVLCRNSRNLTDEQFAEIANRRGLSVAAAVGIVEKIISFLFLVPSSMLSTVSALGAQNMGAGKYERADQILRYAMGIAVGFGLIVSLLIQIIAGPVVGLFTTDATVILLGAQYIRGYIWDCIFAGVHFSFSGYFCAYGKSEISFVHNLIAILCVRIPGVYLTSKIFPDTLFPMGLATATGSLLSVIICMIAFGWLKRKEKQKRKSA